MSRRTSAGLACFLFFRQLNPVSLMLRPSWDDPELFFISASGPSFDIQKGIQDPTYVVHWIRDLTRNKDITITRPVTLAEWQYVASLLRCFLFELNISWQV
jgi:hypothetical protein